MTNIFEEPSSVIQLIEDIANGNVITFVGAGVSISASGNHQTASWVGLIWNCLEYCIKHKYVNRAEYKDIKQKLSKEKLKTVDILYSAEYLSKKLGYEGSVEFESWILDAIKTIPLKSRELIADIGKISPTIITTNYDLLLERVLNSRTIELENTSEVRHALTDNIKRTIHIHGHINNTKHILFSKNSYEEHGTKVRNDFLQKALSFTHSFLFIGCGNGLDDPNLAPWMKSDMDMFASLGTKHYRLIKDGDNVDDSSQNSRIINISYGMVHSDLKPFISSIVEKADALSPNNGRYATHRNISNNRIKKLDLSPYANLPDSKASQLERLGDIALEKRLFPIAINHYKDSIAEERQLYVLLKLTQANVSLGLLNEALSELLNLKKEFGSLLSIQINLIVTYNIIKDYDCLINIAEQVIKETPNILFVWTALISALHSQNKYLEVIKRSAFPILLWPLSENLNDLVAKSNFQLDEYLESLKYYEKILKFKPENRSSLRGKLFILSNLGRKNYRGKIELSKKEYLDQATELAERLVIIDGNNFEVWLSKCVIEKELGNYSEALASVRQAKILETTGYRAELMEARLLIRQKRNREAIKILTRLIKTNKQEPQISFNLAVALTGNFLEKHIHPICPALFKEIDKLFASSMKLDPFNLFFIEEYINFLVFFGYVGEADKYKQQLKLIKSKLSN